MDLQTVSKAITVHSSNIDLGNAFRELAERSILRTTIKYFGRLTTASVNVSRDGTLFHCAVEIQLAELRMVSAEGQHEDCQVAFNEALGEAESQLRRAKRELRESTASRTGKAMPPWDASSSLSMM
ncbi:ribosome-associated translation inhibitor RaiA [Microvirga aerilata]|uniref:Ribosome-associated translation inhibitor RaiA n=1 Tax=Microvirga aerilata TaxID=670292 RepID=A0A936ZEI6_9HYPH|nr:HPF/RaiA family ribosome-associated protein [Microvirga aerilata]MBL0408371.1 ribosome-associated translation inhibitor RaiA [Microvirga aerilata]